jgi:two-component sensor histidine kinase
VAIHQARLHEQTRHDAVAKAELLQEVNHRVGNNLMAIIGLLLTERRYLSAASRPFVEPMLERLIGRVSGLAEVHSMLAKSSWRPVRLSELTERIIRFALSALPAEKRINFAITPSKITVSPRQANHLALVVNELAMNTVKHAMRERSRGNITVLIEDTGENMIRFEYRDDGPGYPDAALHLKEYEVGLYLVRRFVTTTLHGELELKNDHGAVATMCFATEERDRT